jgi:L-fucose mutarotase
MLKRIPPLLSGDLLKILQDMGHGDELTITDANYPAASNAKRLVRIDGADSTAALEAILTLMPLDDFVDAPAFVMSPGPGETPPVIAAYQKVCDTVVGKPVKIAALARFDFYTRAAQSYAHVATNERRLYGNIILKKGIVRPGE